MQSGSSVLNFFGPPEEMSGSSLVGIRSFKGNEFDIDSPQSLGFQPTEVGWLLVVVCHGKQKNGQRNGCLPGDSKCPFLGWWIVTFSEVKWPRTGRWIGYFESPGVYCLNTPCLHCFFFWGGKVQLEKHTVGLSKRHRSNISGVFRWPDIESCHRGDTSWLWTYRGPSCIFVLISQVTLNVYTLEACESGSCLWTRECVMQIVATGWNRDILEHWCIW